MESAEPQRSNFLKIFLPILIIAMAIYIWQNGYGFGQWLHKVLN